ncbi:ABC transporter substrate-binding protein [Arcobacter porcinus]|nr:ABC transporter substrate-binding protein [Arcobacter porcinus]OCL86510.1 hypothetical protein AAX30_01233 [Arcobacter porcinus]OCL96906.1 hypothetical protein AAX27_00540 [Aliarcobacter thereius]
MLKKFIISIFILFIMLIYLSKNRYTNENIVIASSMPLSGIMKPWGEGAKNSIDAYFSYINQNNILDDRKLEFVTLDDKYEPDLTEENISLLLSNPDTFLLFAMVGTPTVKRAIPIINENNSFLFAPFSGASFLRDNNFSTILNFRTSYEDEINSLVDYIVEEKNHQNIAIFYQNDEYGEEGYISFLKALNKHKLNPSSFGTYTRNTLAINLSFNKIKEEKPQTVFLIGSYKANALFIQKAKNSEEFKDTIFCNISFSDANSIVKELKNKDIDTSNLIFSQVVPNYLDENIELTKEYQNLIENYAQNKELSFLSFEAFLASKALVNAIKENINNLSLKRIYKSLENRDCNGLEKKVYLFEYLDDKFIEINP